MADDDFRKKGEKFLRELPVVQTKAVLKAGQRVLRDMNIRIFNKGLNANGAQIGKYSTSPILVGQKSFPTKTDANKAIFSSKKKRKKFDWRTLGSGSTAKRLVLLPGGYKKLRSLSGLQTSRVDLSFRGDLQRGLKLVQRKGAVEIRLNGSKNIKKAEGNEKRFGAPIFEATDVEVGLATRIIQDDINDLINEIFK